MFRRTSKTETVPTASAAELSSGPKGPGAKGRPTPSRREAEAAARARSRTVMDKKTAQKVMREKRVENNAKVRQAMRTGDERYLPARDKGPVKRFIRDHVDARLSVAEFLLPLLLVIMVLQYTPNDTAVRIGLWLWQALLLVIVVDTGWLVVRTRRAIREKFPEEPLKGTTFYTVLRAAQMRFLRQPKPRVKLGGAPR
ncbi:DUF3043 domain-containing protein [Nocardioides korecus]